MVHKEVGHWPYLAIVAVVAVVAVVFLVMKGGVTPVVESSSEASAEVPSEIEIYDDEGNIAGAARWSGGGYRQTTQVVRSDDDNCRSCTSDCKVCGKSQPDECNLCKKGTSPPVPGGKMLSK